MIATIQKLCVIVAHILSQGKIITVFLDAVECKLEAALKQWLDFEEQLDKQNNILDVIAESAVPIDSIFEKELEKMITSRTRAAGTKIKKRVVPDLLAGYRLHFGSWYVDASLKGIMEKMAADLIIERDSPANTALAVMPVQR